MVCKRCMANSFTFLDGRLHIPIRTGWKRDCRVQECELDNFERELS